MKIRFGQARERKQEKALMCFLGSVSGVAARGKKEHGLNGVTHVWLDLVRQ